MHLPWVLVGFDGHLEARNLDRMVVYGSLEIDEFGVLDLIFAVLVFAKLAQPKMEIVPHLILEAAGGRRRSWRGAYGF